MLILKNACLINFHPSSVQQGVDIVIDNNIITEVGKNLAASHKSAKVINLNGKLVSPGIVCSHNHFYSMLSRGIMAKIKPSGDFISVLQNLWWRLDLALDDESLYYSGLTGALEAIKSGTTSVIDHNASPSYIKGSLNLLRKSFEQVGLRGILAYEITDRNGEIGMMEGVDESVEFAKTVDEDRKANPAEHLVEAAFGGHAPFTLSNNTLKLISEKLKGTNKGIHFHVAEDQYDGSYSHHHFAKDIVKRLDDFNLLNNKSILVHGVYLNDNDINILNERDAFLVHNTRSNMNNSVGYMNKLNQVKNPALGTDGIGSNMFDEMKFAFFKNADAKGKISMDDVFRMLDNGNVILSRYFGKKFGRIEKGFAADLVIYDYNAPTPLVNENLQGHLIFGFESHDVETVIINGKIVYENRAFPFDTEEIYAESKKAAKSLWSKMDAL
ncbi:MAG: putative aminohydrolase SsnA [Ignavibacteriaceae bacterium]|nr:putative aminohydrolase SsnA [Ignavibacteriaceae bacterium]